MAGKSPARKTSAQKTSQGRTRSVIVHQGESPRVDEGYIESSDEVLEELNKTDPFAGLFGDGMENVTVELFRDQPVKFAGVDIGGFCDNLLPGATLKSIKEEYGGGSYNVLKRNTLGQIVTRRHFRIGGFPVAVPPLSSTPIPGPGGADAPSSETDVQWERRMRRLLAERALLKSDGDGLSPVLSEILPLILPAVVARLFEHEDPLEKIVKVKELADSFSGQSTVQTENPWVLALDKFATLLTERASVRRPVPAQTQPVAQIEARPVAPQGESPLMFQQVAQWSVETIGNGFLSDPQSEPGQIVSVLELQLGVAEHPGIRDQIKTHKEKFREMVRLYVSSMIEGQAEWIGELGIYFDSVFDAFCSPEIVKEELGGTKQTDAGAGPATGPEVMSGNIPGEPGTD